MWWECNTCVEGGNNPQAADAHKLRTGHTVTIMQDMILEEDS